MRRSGRDKQFVRVQSIWLYTY